VAEILPSDGSIIISLLMRLHDKADRILRLLGDDGEEDGGDEAE